MICDIIVRAAQFEVLVVATRELLFHNEIFQPGQQFTMVEQANFLLPGSNVRSFQEALELVGANTQRLQAKVGELMRPTLQEMGWQISYITARHLDQWQVLLQAANSDARNDDSLIQLA